MSSRKPVYLFGVSLLALVFSAPQLWMGFALGTFYVQSGELPLPPIPGFGETWFYTYEFEPAAFWRDKFIQVGYLEHRPNGDVDWKWVATDPETGITSDLGGRISGPRGFTPMAIGDRLWIVGDRKSFEVVDDELRPSSATDDTLQRSFLLDGQIARAWTVNGGQFVSSMDIQTGAWINPREIDLPLGRPEWTFGKTRVNFQNVSALTVVNQGDRLHLFLRSGGHLLHREGLKLLDSSPEQSNAAPGPGVALNERPISALNAVNTDDAIAGWSLVREEAGDKASWDHRYGMFVGGQPAALIIDFTQAGTPVGRVYRFDGTTWVEFASQSFPFGSTRFRTVHRQDGMTSYIVASTSMGAGQIYIVDPSGLRRSSISSPISASGILGPLIFYAALPIASMIVGTILGSGLWLLMWLFTKPDYEFGTCSVKLASVARRGLARLIDLALIVLSTAGLGWYLSRKLDWAALLEALNLRVDHPTVPEAMEILVILGLWLLAVILFLLVIQARWGLSPGKWCCGVRTLRSTLKPCGIARSLVREVVLAVDTCNLLCWTPGLFSIALTDRRQRLGDLVADTLVVEARSLKD